LLLLFLLVVLLLLPLVGWTMLLTRQAACKGIAAVARAAS
jgi:hypothetical protein